MITSIVKKSVMICLVVSVFFCVPLSSYAEEEDLDSLKEQLNSIESEISQLESEKADLQATIDALEGNGADSEGEDVQAEGGELEGSTDEIQILEEYTLADSIGWYTRHFMVIKNKTDETLQVSSQSLAYDSDGALISVANASVYALGAGCTTAFYEAFQTDVEIASYDTTITTSESKNYDSVVENLSYVETDVDRGAIFQVTNDGADAVPSVEGYVLFFLDGELVGYSDTYFHDDDSEIKPGDTITKQVTSYDDFDTIEFYMDGKVHK